MSKIYAIETGLSPFATNSDCYSTLTDRVPKHATGNSGDEFGVIRGIMHAAPPCLHVEVESQATTDD